MNISWQNDINARSKIDFQGCFAISADSKLYSKTSQAIASIILTPGNNFLVNFGEKN